MDITGRTVFIPGATSGIGRALSAALHDAGATVIAGGGDRPCSTNSPPSTRASAPSSSTSPTPRRSPPRGRRDRPLPRDGHADHHGRVLRARGPHRRRLRRRERPDGHDEHPRHGAPRRRVHPSTSSVCRAPSSRSRRASRSPPWPPMPTYSATKAFVHSFTDSLRLQFARQGRPAFGRSSRRPCRPSSPPGIRPRSGRCRSTCSSQRRWGCSRGRRRLVVDHARGPA